MEDLVLISQKQIGGYWLFGGEPSYLNTSYALMALSGQKMPFSNRQDQPTSHQSLTRPKLHHVQSHQVVTVTEMEDVTQISTSQVGSCSASASASASVSNGVSSASAWARAECH
jgi:putative Ca2+/H+ antiporter (TMEM165/GDT1 family)